MAVAVFRSRALSGMHAPGVVVEAHLANGLTAFTLVGLPETARVFPGRCWAASIARLNLSARAYHRVLKPARSVADLAGNAAIRYRRQPG